RLLPLLFAPLGWTGKLLLMLEPARGIRVRGPSRRLNPWIERLWQLAVWLSFAAAIWFCARYVLTTLGGRDIAEVLVL
ncbi:hypothetical protein ABTM10_20415, partial [Acinetobacter baumannii]